MARFTTYFGVDWDKNGTYTDESDYVKTIKVRRGRPNTLDTSTGFVICETGELWGTLRNSNNRYDPFNSSSPLYGNILPARPVKVTVTSGGVTHDVFYGWLTDLRPMGEDSQEAVFRCKDGLEFLNMQGCDTIGVQTNYLASSALNDLLDQSDWLVGDVTINDNGDQIPSF